MQDHAENSREADRESRLGLNGIVGLPASGKPSPVRWMPRGEATRCQEFDRLRQNLDLANQEVKALREQNRLQEQRLRELALMTFLDQQTGLRNRRQFRKDLEAAWAYAVRHDLLLSTIVLDLNQLESCNACSGEDTGDQVLHDVAVLLASGMRTYDLVARLGDGLFALGLPSTDRSEARQIAQRIRTAMVDHDWPMRPITAGFGVATLESSTTSCRQLVHQSFQALRQAKLKGGDRVEHFVDL